MLFPHHEQFLPVINKLDIKTYETREYYTKRSAPFGCTDCFLRKYDYGINSECELVSTLVGNYNDELSAYVEIYPNILCKVLKKGSKSISV